MNDLARPYRRNRSQTLLIVEGNHEKDELFGLIFHSFPELSIETHNIWIYGTNIYMLYEAIVKEYGETWYKDDIDLPLLISTKKDGTRCYKQDFTNIYLVFDYERHDPNFSEQKISRMQEYFSDVTDPGKLYINYPMIESYQHLRCLPDSEYIDLKVPVSLQPGKKYKELVRDSFMNMAVSHTGKVRNILAGRFGVVDEDHLNRIVEGILSQNNEGSFLKATEELLKDTVAKKDVKTALYQLKDLVWKIGYVRDGNDYWRHMRNLFKQVIRINIDKAYRIQYGKACYENNKLESRGRYDSLDERNILHVQNEASRCDHDGFIWVLSTCILLVAEYNFRLLD